MSYRGRRAAAILCRWPRCQDGRRRWLETTSPNLRRRRRRRRPIAALIHYANGLSKRKKNVEKSMKASDCKSLSEYNKNKEERERERGTCGMASSFQLPGRASSAHVHLYKRPKSFLGWIDGCSKSFFKIISSELVEIQS